MLLFYIRHGDPIYNPDSLTPLGERQAEAVAQGLQELAKLETKCAELKRAMTEAEKTVNDHKQNLAGIRAAIEQLRSQLENAVDVNAEELEMAKQTVMAEKNAITQQQKVLHARLTANKNAKKNRAYI